MRSSLFIAFLFIALASSAQNENVTYHQEPRIAELMDIYKLYSKKNDLADGYRLQISFSNDRQEVYNNKAKVYKDFPSDRAYVEYEQPYYKLRIGDFASRLQAYEKLNDVIKKYPGAFVVRDKVRLR
ncbi:MAG: hypothetical protein JWO03_850 [Bacteroidetes bacterium]|nr:hypothetical protein [Bacteroidota bacterium]